MALLLKHRAKIVRGNIVPDDIALAKHEISQLEGKRIVFFFTEHDELYHPELMAYYRAGIIREASKHEAFGGWSEDEIHDWVKQGIGVKSFSKMKQAELKDAIEKAKDLFYQEHEIEFRDRDLYYEVNDKELI